MDDLSLNSKQPVDDLSPIPFDDEPIPFDLEDSGPAGGGGQGGISHAPLTLGGGAKPAAGKPGAAPPQGAAKVAKAQIKPPNAPHIGASSAKKGVKRVSTAERVSGLKTFFTKLHPGALAFLDEQVNDWLAANPGVKIKLTNTTVGEVQSKKSEPNIIMSIWY